jgi:AcrR family transcriptional regulator
MGRPRADAHAVPTRERILVAAEVEFGALGYGPARLEDIAAQAGIRRPSLLYHFETKDVLYAAVVERLFKALRSELQGAMATTAPFEETILHLADVYLRFCAARSAYATLVIRDILDHRDPVYGVLQETIVPVVDEVTRYVERRGVDVVPEGLPVRQALLMFCVNAMVRVGSGPLRTPLWGEGETGLDLARQLFIR